MKTRTLSLTLILLFVASAALADLKGAWTATSEEKRPGRIHFNISRGLHHNSGNTMKVSDFAGLSEAQIRAAAQTPVQFRMARDAGTATFDGFFRDGDGAGQFTFAGNPAYADAVRALGVKFDLSNRRDSSDEEDLFALTLHDVSTEFIRTMQAEGYRVGLETYMSMRIFNVNTDYIRELRALGFKDLDADELVATRIHGVTPDYIRKMRAAGWDLSLGDLMSSRIHGATPEFAEEMRKLGYGNLPHDDLVSFRIHGVTAEFIGELRALGYDKIDADDLVAMRIHGVTPSFIRELEAAGYKNVPVDKLVAMRIHGVDAKFIRKMNEVD